MDEKNETKEDGELIDVRKIILIIAIIGLLLISAIGAQAIIQPLTIAGKLKDKNGYPIGGWNIYSKNMRTAEIITNGTFNVTSTGGYQIQWGNSQYGWQTGDIIKIWAWYHDGGKNYTDSQQITVPTDILQQGSFIGLDLKMDEYVGELNNGSDTGDGRTNGSFTVFGTVKKEGTYIDGVTVTVKNMYTGNTTTNKTHAGGKYNVDLGILKKGWKVGDKIRVNATYQNYAAETTFVVYQGVTQRQKDMTLWLMVDSPFDNFTFPLTFEELFALYNVTHSQLIDRGEELDALQNKTDDLQDQLSEQNENVTALTNQLGQQKGELPWIYIALIAGMALAIAFLLYKMMNYRAILIERSQGRVARARTMPIRRQ